jgi:hypothetical protein
MANNIYSLTGNVPGNAASYAVMYVFGASPRLEVRESLRTKAQRKGCVYCRQGTYLKITFDETLSEHAPQYR